jgi:hypothetical protein
MRENHADRKASEFHGLWARQDARLHFFKEQARERRTRRHTTTLGWACKTHFWMGFYAAHGFVGANWVMVSQRVVGRDIPLTIFFPIPSAHTPLLQCKSAIQEMEAGRFAREVTSRKRVS